MLKPSLANHHKDAESERTNNSMLLYLIRGTPSHMISIFQIVGTASHMIIIVLTQGTF